MDDSLNTALKIMAAADLRELPVVSKEDPTKVVSIVSRKEIIRTYHDEIERMKRPDISTAWSDILLLHREN